MKMYSQKTLILLLSAVSFGSLPACTSSSGDASQQLLGGAPQQQNDNGFKNIISGPSVDGTWKSACVASVMGSAPYETITLTIGGQNVTREADGFSDASCTQSAGPQIETGLLRYTSVTPDGTYAVEYRFSGTTLNETYSEYENYKLTGTNLFISNEVGGEVVPEVEMTNTTIAPTPVQSPAAPLPSANATNARFLDCLGATYELYADFSQVDLSQMTIDAGAITYGIRAVNTTANFSFFPDNADSTASLFPGAPSFTYSAQDDSGSSVDLSTWGSDFITASFKLSATITGNATADTGTCQWLQSAKYLGQFGW